MIIFLDISDLIGQMIKIKMFELFEQLQNVDHEFDTSFDEKLKEYTLQGEMIRHQPDSLILIITHQPLYIIVKVIRGFTENDIPDGYDIKTLNEYDLKFSQIEPVLLHSPEQ